MYRVLKGGKGIDSRRHVVALTVVSSFKASGTCEWSKFRDARELRLATSVGVEAVADNCGFSSLSSDMLGPVVAIFGEVFRSDRHRIWAKKLT